MQRNLKPELSMTTLGLPLCYCTIALVLAACGSTEPGTVQNSGLESSADSLEARIAQAQTLDDEERARLSLDIAADLQAAGISDLSQLALTDITPEEISDPIIRVDIVLLSAEQLLAEDEFEAALSRLQEIDIADVQVPPDHEARYLTLMADSLAGLDRPAEALANYIAAGNTVQLKQNQSDAIWSMLQGLDNNRLQELASSASSYEGRGWIELSRVFRNDQFSIRGQLDAIAQWQRIWAQHSAVDLLPSALQELSVMWDNRPREIALLLPLQQPAGLAIQEGFLGAYYQALDISREVPRLSVYDTSQSNNILDLYEQARAAGADLIIGPLDKAFVNQLHAQESLPVPTLALNYADAAGPGPSNLFQFGLAPEDEIRQASLAAWDQGYRNAALLTPGSADYQRLQSVFANSWSTLGGRLVSRTSFANDTDFTDVVKRLMAVDSSEARADRLLDILPRNNMEFTPRRRQDIDFIFLMANPRQGRQIKPTLAFYFAEDVPVYALPSIYDGLNNRSADQDLNGINFAVEPWLIENNSLKSEFNAAMRPAQGPLQRLRALGIDSFRLYARLQQFQSGQLQSVRGVTGTLRMTADQRLQRSLQMAQFQDGIAVPISRIGNIPGD